MFSKILICSDGSGSANDGVRIGVEVGQRFNSDIHLLNVIDPPYFLVQPQMSLATMEQNFLEQYKFLEQGVVEASAKPLFAEAGIKYTFVQDAGYPMEVITLYARKEDVDLVVVGSRGRSGVLEFMIGSTSNGVMHHSPCSVLIVRGDHIPEGTGEFQHILLVTDGSVSAHEATLVAIEMAKKFSTSLHVLYVTEPAPSALFVNPHGIPVFDGFDYDTYNESQLKSMKLKILEAAKTEGVYCDFETLCGNPASEILKYAKRTKIDLVVIGSRGRNEFVSMALGSVSERVAHHAECPVLIAREKKSDQIKNEMKVEKAN